MSRQVIDLILFGYDVDMLEGRLETLASHVDRFVIVESSTTHTGKYKGFVLENHFERFSRFSNKILHFKVEGKSSVDPWENERYHREQCELALAAIQPHPDDLVLYCDTDEWWDPRHLNLFGESLQALNMKKFHYSVRWFDKMELGAVAGPARDFVGCNMYDLKFRSRSNLPILKSGIHLTSMGSWSDIEVKIASFAHSEFNNPLATQWIHRGWERGFDSSGKFFTELPLDGLPIWIGSHCAPESW